MTSVSTWRRVAASGTRYASTHVLQASRWGWVGMDVHVSLPPKVPKACCMPLPPQAIQFERACEAPLPKAMRYVCTEEYGSPLMVPSALTVPDSGAYSFWAAAAAPRAAPSSWIMVVGV